MIEPTDGITFADTIAYLAGVKLGAAAEDAVTPSYDLVGRFYVSEKHDGRSWGLLTVPNAMVRGVFDALHAPGIQLPINSDGSLDAHITVLRPEEIEQAGGVAALSNDRGKPFRYSLGRLIEFTPHGWAEMDRCWVIRVHSAELQALRRSHGLSSIPNEGKFDFHITVATRRKGVLSRSATAKDTTAA